ncbi:MAG TPA: CapA family protein [Solirubrobacterales bacterium]|nr:CapA family protein [Solirubrobacterales bacterium]
MHATPATYRRRRIVAVLALVTAVVGVVLAVRGAGGASEEEPATPQERRAQELEAEPVRLQLSFSGDLLIHSPVYAQALAIGGGQSYDFEPMLAELRPYVNRPDLAVCHAETPISADAPVSGYPLFNAPPELADAVAATGWDACDTASNHTLDLGQEGVEATIRSLGDAGLEQTGSYGSRRAQRRTLMLEAEGLKVALVSYTTDTNGIPPPETYSVNVATAPEPVIADARRARERGADAVIVTMHWASQIAPEYTSEPSDAVRRFARRLARAEEITAIVGHGPHVIQPIEWIAGKPVLFSVGNLISNQTAACCAEASQDGIVGLIDLVVDGDGDRAERVTYVPVYVNHPEYTVLPVGDALDSGQGDPASLAASYERTVSVAGRGERIEPVPRRLGTAG